MLDPLLFKIVSLDNGINGVKIFLKMGNRIVFKVSYLYFRLLYFNIFYYLFT